MTSQNANDRCLSHGLGSDPRGTLESMCVEGPVSHMVHQPSGDVGCISCSQEFPSRSQGPPCACPLRQHICGLLHKSPGGFAVMSTLQTGVPNPPVVPREVVVSSSSLHSGDPQYKSRHPVETGAEARGMEASPRGGGADMEGVRPSTSGSACFSRDVSLSTLVLPHTSSSSRTGRDGAEVAKASFGVLARSVHCRANPVYFGGLCGAISAYHMPLGGISLGRDPLVSRFLRGTLMLKPAARTMVPTWDLAIVLQGLSLPLFEPLEEVPAKFFTLKALFLLAISSLKRIGDLQALSVAPSCLVFAPGMVKSIPSS